MSLFLKNLPKSFYRSVISSRPIFNKAHSLFSSIAVNANRTATLSHLAISRIGNSHARAICFGDEKNRYMWRRHSFSGVRHYAKKAKKSSSADAKKSTKSKKGSASKKTSSGSIKSGGVTCTVGKHGVQCEIDCSKYIKEKKEDGECSPSDKPSAPPPAGKSEKKATSGPCASASKTEGKKSDLCTSPCKPDYTKDEKSKSSTSAGKSKKGAKKCKSSRKKGQGMNRIDSIDANDLAGTWMSTKCIKFDFTCPGGVASKGTKPVKVDDEPATKKKSDQSIILQCIEDCKKTPSKANMSTRSIDGGGTRKSKDCISVSVTVTVEDKGDPKVSVATKKKNAKDKSSCGTSKKSKGHKKSQKDVCKSGSNEKKSGDKPCKPCSSKKQVSGKKQCAGEDENASRSGRNNKLIVKVLESDKDENAKKIEQLTKELEDCKRSKSAGGARGGGGECQPSPKLDGCLPKPKEQEKDVIGGSKNFIKSVCDGILSKEGDANAEKASKTSSKGKSGKKSSKIDCKKKKESKKKEVCKGKDTKSDKKSKCEPKKSEDKCQKKQTEEKKECGKKESKTKAKEPCSKGSGEKLKPPCEYEYVKSEGAKDCKKMPFQGRSEEKTCKKEGKEKVSKSKTSINDKCSEKKSTDQVKRQKKASKVGKKEAATCPHIDERASKRKIICTDDPDRDPSKKHSGTVCKKDSSKSEKKAKSETKLDKCAKKTKSEPKLDKCAKKAKSESKLDKCKPESSTDIKACIKKCASKESKKSDTIKEKRSKSKTECSKSGSQHEVNKKKSSTKKCIEPCKKSSDSKAGKKVSCAKSKEKLSKSKSECLVVGSKPGVDSSKKKERGASKSAECRRSTSKSKSSTSTCSPKSKSQTKLDPCQVKIKSECDRNKKCPPCTKSYSKEELLQMLKDCEKQRQGVRQWSGKEKKYSGPPDQSPIMQCIALCQKKRKANEPQKGKGVPPRDKRPVTEDKQVFKKLVEFDEEENVKKCQAQESKEGKEAKKDDIKPFVPCKYENIKPGIRNEAGDVKKAKESGSNFKKKKPKKMPKCSTGKEKKKPKTKEAKKKEPEKTVEKKHSEPQPFSGKTCPKFANPCKEQKKDDPCESSKEVCPCPETECESVKECGENKEESVCEETCAGSKEESKSSKECRDNEKKSKNECEEEEFHERLGRKEDPCVKNKKEKTKSDIDPCEEIKAKLRAKQKEKCEKEKGKGDNDDPCLTIEDKCKKCD